MKKVVKLSCVFPALLIVKVFANILPLNITKRVFYGAQCYQFETSAGLAFLAMPSVMDILKHEKMVVAAYTILASRVVETEKKFNDIVTKGSLDLTALLANTEKSSDPSDPLYDRAAGEFRRHNWGQH